MSPPYVPVAPAQLPAWLDDDGLLVLDVRPSAAYNSARLPRALSLAVPTTLIKRPLFSLDRLAAMLSNADARARFANWASASRILVYDADSAILPESSIINALLKKFRTEGFVRDLAWIRGGFQAILRDASIIIDTHPFDSRADEEDENDASCLPTHSVLRPNRLPMAAFTISSTTLSSYDMAPALHQKSKPPALITIHSGVEIPRIRPAFNPFFDVVRQNIELSHGITERIPLYLPRYVHRRIHELPFRWLQDIARRAAPRPRLDDFFTEKSDLEGEQSVDPAVVAQGAEAFATQFHKIESAEQRRLMSILERHTRESGKDGALGNESFPFSITAGIEKGEKNRYRHIWPFEHARVRLHHKRDSDDDYVNASYVQPLGTKRRYIATQGPLPVTFQDFWMLCWEQNVHVIVMLTREVEGSMVKCGAYWTDTVFGPLHLRLISSTGQTPTNNVDNMAGYFDPHPSVTSPIEMRSPDGSVKASRQSTTIKRVFELTNANYPHVKPRRVVHFQYLEWLDMTVPDDPRGVLELVREVDKAVQEAHEGDETCEAGREKDGVDDETLHAELDERTGITKCAKGRNSPILLHCSAGVGRTGGFIAVDAVLDAIRKEMGKSSHRRQPHRPKRALSLHSVRNGVDLKATKQADVTMFMSESGGSSSSSAFPACSDSSSSDDSFDFDRNARTSGKHQLVISTPGCSASSQSSTIPIRSSARIPVPDLSSPDQASKPNIATAPLSNSATHGQGQSREPRVYILNSSDEGGLPSRSISPSPDESESNAPQGRSTIPPTLGRVPSPSPFTYSEASLTSLRLKEPRRLHDDKSPIELGIFDEPIWEVVQDMREQRMSLCQSLRQYVFVHAAVIEGALMIVDEERQRDKLNSQTASWQPTPPISPKIQCKAASDSKGNKIRPVGLSVRSNGLTSAILTGKRVASPTELPKENKQGQVQLSKRPSLQKAKSP